MAFEKPSEAKVSRKPSEFRERILEDNVKRFIAKLKISVIYSIVNIN